MNSTVGQKIKNFRKRAGKSQFELELDIEASPGSISRIESGEVNPTKETLTKIAEVLKLTTQDAGTLYNLDFELKELPRMVNLAKKLNSLELDTILQSAVDDVVFSLGLNGAVILLVEGDYLRTKNITDVWESKAVMKLLKLVNFDLKISLSKPTENVIVKCVKDQKTYQRDSLRDFTVDVISARISDMSERITIHKSGLVIPLVHDKKSIGAIFFSKSDTGDFEKEISTLEAVAEYITQSIVNAQKFQELKSLKN